MKKSLVFLLIMAILCVSIPFSVSADDADVYVGGVAMSQIFQPIFYLMVFFLLMVKLQLDNHK